MIVEKKLIVSIFIFIILAGGCAAGYLFYCDEIGETRETGVENRLHEEEVWFFGDEEKELPIIMYHGVTENRSEVGAYVVSVQSLENDLMWLQERGYETVSTAELLEFVNGEGKLPQKPVMITFDDGMINNMTLAFPVMQKYGAKGVYSVVGKYCECECGYMSWEDLAEFNRSPLVEIQNHSYDMHELNKRRGSSKMKGEGVAQYTRSFAGDTSKMQQLIREKLGITATAYTYPFGIISEESIPVIESLGFQLSFTCYEKGNRIVKGDKDSLYLLNRYNRSGNPSTEGFMKRIMESGE